MFSFAKAGRGKEEKKKGSKDFGQLATPDHNVGPDTDDPVTP